MRRFGPRSLIGQMALLIGIALLIAQAVNFGLILNERQKLSLAQNQGPAIARFVAVAGDFTEAVPEFKTFVLEDNSRRGAQFSLGRSSAIPRGAARDGRVEARVRLALRAAGVIAPDVRAAFTTEPRRRAPEAGEGGDRQILTISARVGHRAWLNGRIATPAPDPLLTFRLGIATLILYALVLGATLLIALRLARPLRDLTSAADRFGGREAPRAVEPRGPADLKRPIEAFNAMNARVMSLLDEKDRMLGAIGHDLRTPLASLRIRVESVDDDTERERMIATIEEMATMLEDVLVLARSGRAREEARLLEVTALVDAVAEEFRELGHDVTMEPSTRQVLEVQPTLLRRAVRNLVDNAVKYGGSARLFVREEGEQLLIEVTDEGPGLPPEHIHKVLEPFYRAEESRNRDTGGTGLGLSIAKAVAESHGGSLRLRNGASGGLVATLSLPKKT